VVDADDGGLRWGGCVPSPCDLLAAVRHEERVNGELGLKDALAVVEGGSGAKGYTTELETLVMIILNAMS